MKSNEMQFNLAATCGGGTESLVAAEIESYGGQQIAVERGAVLWRGGLETAYRACLWSRVASRIFLYLKSFPVTDENDLYQGSLQVDWSAHLKVTTTFAVDCTVLGKETKIHSRFAALRVKDAVVDQFRQESGERPSVDTGRPGVRIHVLVREGQASLAIDLAGESLHRRGYRVDSTMAPLKENLAAAIVLLSSWPDLAKSGAALLDPMCGSGTLLIEAGLIFSDSAPGLSRSYFGFMGWRQHNQQLWLMLVDEALEREQQDSAKDWPLIQGYDADPHAVSAARKNIEKAGLDDRIQVKQAELATFRAPSEAGCILSNLPYGERLSEAGYVHHLYQAVGRIVRQQFAGWQLGVFISNPELTDSFGLAWQDKYHLYNGAIPCRLLLGNAEDTRQSPFFWQLPEAPQLSQGQDFANRFSKNLKKTLKWAKKERLSCFRVYDRDMAEYNVSIDFYGKWVNIQEYAAPKTVAPEKAAERFQLILRTVRETLGIRADRVFIKRREKQRGNSQYQRKSERKKMYQVEEGACHFLVNFTDYLDTGLFLDHRPLRKRIYLEAEGKRFLNLYGYTGTATVHAALGKAALTTTVDLSENYLRWTRMNLALNGLDTVRNTLVCADCLEWLQEQTAKYDYIFVDPPTFSNTKKKKRVFDLQRDHARLLQLAMTLLEQDGVLIFSTNFRNFQLDENLVKRYTIRDITRDTIPFDFMRNPRIHKCWELRF